MRPLLLLFFIVLVVYLRFLRPWQLHWGASDEELARPMPGDDIVAAPTFNATRAVTIHAQPEHVFPWIVQIGNTRAGWYGIDFLDNLGKPSAEVILPQFQQLVPGDLIPMNPDGKQGAYVKDFVANQWMLWWDKQGIATWVWGLYPVDEDQTRLVTRIRIRYHWLSPRIFSDLLVEFVNIFMLRASLFGIKRRAEKLARAASQTPTGSRC